MIHVILFIFRLLLFLTLGIIVLFALEILAVLLWDSRFMKLFEDFWKYIWGIDSD